MNLMNEQAVGFFVPLPTALEAVLARLNRLSRRPEFVLQREAGIARALKPYLEADGIGRVLAALPEEGALANLLLFCDFYPEDGQFTLIEQLRDVITEHIPDDERIWLDPLKHSYLDLLEVVTPPQSGAALTLRSLGDGVMFILPYEDFCKELSVGQILLTRVIQDPRRGASQEAVWAGSGLILSNGEGKALYEKTRAWERRMEMSSGELVLGEWQEFTKRFGHVLMWNFADMRMAALADAVTRIRYRTPSGDPYLYAIALYDHHEYQLFSDGLSGMTELQAEPSVLSPHGTGQPAASSNVWTVRADGSGQSTVVARLTLTSSQLIVECDSRERLNDVKHRLAQAFGFALHFRSETVTPPYRNVSIEELRTGQPVTVVISEPDDRTMLQGFLEKVYLEWSDHAHLMLDGQTPRQAASRPASRDTVDRLLAEMEANDPGLRRGGRRAYDYNILRGHIGLDEKN